MITTYSFILAADSTNILPILIAPILVFLGALLGKLFDYIVTRRTNAGNVKTSDADTLWNAQQLFLASVLDQLKSAQTEIHDLRELNDKMAVDLKDLKVESDKWQARAQSLDEELFDLGERLKREMRKSGPY